MKSFVTLFLAGLVLFVSGQFFGWWNAPIPGVDRIPSYEERKNAREAIGSLNRRRAGLEDENGNAIENNRNSLNARRRTQALEEGGQEIGGQ